MRKFVFLMLVFYAAVPHGWWALPVVFAIIAGYGHRSPALVGAALSVVGIVVLLWSAAAHRRELRHSSASRS